MRRADLERAAYRLAGVLGEDGLLVGGLAVGAHGYVRATRDVDFVTRLPLRDVKKRLGGQGIDAVLVRGDVLEGGFPCIKGTLAGVRFDILPQLVPLDWDRAIALSSGRTRTLRVVDAEGLLRLKFRAGGPRDLMDAAALTLRSPELRGLAREIASAYGAVGRFDTWLADPRLKAEIDEAIASERALEKAVKPGAKPRRGSRRSPGRKR
jgi:hypothetical protein